MPNEIKKVEDKPEKNVQIENDDQLTRAGWSSRDG